MIGIEAPFWLLLLGLLPLIRWLHRFRSASTILPTSTLFLWSRLQGKPAAGGSPGKPDPRWLLRAAICALLILALARPWSQQPGGLEAEIWVDDSLSMFTLEQESSRMQDGIRQLQAYLQQHGFSRIRLHSLGEPAASLPLDLQANQNWLDALQAWASHPRAEPSPPPLIALAPASAHILITDGADDHVNRWAQTAPLARVIRSGKLTQNYALSQLSLRASLADPEAVSGTLRIDNLGDVAGSARLVIARQQSIVETRDVEIAPAGSRVASFSLAPGKSGPVEARLEIAEDPLPLDNQLQLEPAELQPAVAYSVIGDCASRLMAVIDSHPAFIGPRDRADLVINCSGEASGSTQPALNLHSPSSVLRTTQTAHWHRDLSTGYLPIPAGVVYSDAAPALSSGKYPLLSANGRMLILKQSREHRDIDVYLDSGDAGFSRDARYPLLILALVSELTGRSLESSPLTIRTDPRASRIAPLPLSAATAFPPGIEPVKDFYTGSLLLLILVLVLADMSLVLFKSPGKPNWKI